MHENQLGRVVRLGEIGQSLIGLTYSPRNVSRFGTLVLRSSNIQDGQLTLEDTVYVNSVIPPKLRLRDGDILICVRNGSRRLIGKSVLLDCRTEGETFGAFMAVFRSEYNNYLRYFFQSPEFKYQVDADLGATINQITNRSLTSFEVFLPSEEEQRRIVDILEQIDQGISDLRRTVSKKRDIKQAVMQHLLTGRIRMPGFDGEWIKCSYKELLVVNRGSMITRARAGVGSIPIIAGGKTPSGTTDKANRAGNTITISASGANAGYVSMHHQPIFASDCSTISESNRYDLDFIYYGLCLRQKEIYKSQTGGAQPHIHPNDIYAMRLDLPAEIEEQRAISRSLAVIDEELTLLENKIAKLQEIKQGIIQRLLPGRTRSPEAEEGKS